MFESASETETLDWARKFSKGLRPGSVLALVGEIGSGKTLFVKGLASGLGVKHPEAVKSPTFVILHLYRGKYPIQHFDLYRLERSEELEAVGFSDFVQDPKAISVVEWADRAAGWIPPEAVWIQFETTGPTRRRVTVRP